MENKKVEEHRQKTGRYFIAIIPPEPVYGKIEKLKNHLAEHYETRASLNSPPHITLHMPFEWKKEKEGLLCDGLRKFFEHVDDFEIELLNFSCFEPRTIFIAVTRTEELVNLEAELHRFCKKEFNLFNARYHDLPFHPHITVAFRDLRKPTFAKAWDEFKEKKFEELFRVVKIVLLKHNGELWQPLQYFSLL